MLWSHGPDGTEPAPRKYISSEEEGRLNAGEMSVVCDNAGLARIYVAWPKRDADRRLPLAMKGDTSRPTVEQLHARGRNAQPQ